jgi:hypothetical protein
MSMSLQGGLQPLKVRDWDLCVAFVLILGTLALAQTRLPDGGQAW